MPVISETKKKIRPILGEDSAAFTPYNSRDVMGLKVLKNNHKWVRQLRDEYGYPSHHGNKVWNSSIVLMDYFKKHPIKRRSRVLEIGCGWAITAIYCAKNYQCSVAGLDIDKSVLPFAQLHAEINGVEIAAYAKSYQKASKTFLSEFDVIVGGDICFWDELSTPLYNLTRRAVDVGARVIIADPGRAPFMTVANRACDKLNADLHPWNTKVEKGVFGWVMDTE